MSSNSTKKRYTFRISPEGRKPFNITLPEGRDQWALSELIKAGSKGCTPIDTPGPRWSAYKHKLLRKYRVPIDRKDEPHKGKYPGTHARYTLACKAELVKVEGNQS